MILADPPWHFETFDGESAIPTQASDPYTSMTFDDLCALPVESVAAKDCALFMWHSGTHTDQAIDLAKAWGFKFVRSEVFVWIKTRDGYSPKPGMGYYSRNGAEVCALFKRGSPKVLSRGVEQVIICPRGGHSSKPHETYERIEQMIAGPYLELFARERRKNWSSWGNEVGSRDGTLFPASGM